MKKNVIIFGTRDLAQLAKFYFETDSDLNPVCFTVDRQYYTEESFEGLPVIPFDEIEQNFSSKSNLIFVPMTHAKMGFARKNKYLEAKAKGYDFANYISSHATYFGTSIGENCFIFEDNTIQPFTKIGNNVVLWSGNHIGHHSVIMDHVFLTSHVVISGHCVVEPHSFFGVNSTVRDNILIKEGTLVAMGAVINKNTEPYGVYFGSKQILREDIKSTDLL